MMNEGTNEQTVLLANTLTLERELQWFVQVLDLRLQAHRDPAAGEVDVFMLVPPSLEEDQSDYARFVRHYQFRFGERLILILSLVPHLRPQLLDKLLARNPDTGRFFTEYGGVAGQMHNGFLPTGETACFLLAGNDLALRLYVQALFAPGHLFHRHGILQLGVVSAPEPAMSGTIEITSEYLSLLTTGKPYHPPFSAVFPARLLETPLTWEDLILDNAVKEEIETMLLWLRLQEDVGEGEAASYQGVTGYRALFYGPPGTGKSLTASLLGRTMGRKVYRIDLSQVVSKYIGETEKNLASLFDTAENKGWILFFDEADALFGKRTELTDAKDKFANQETAYLLQRIEDYNGLIILATNLKPNIDAAFTRRFQSIVYFRSPTVEQREALWSRALARNGGGEVDISRIAAQYEISGGAMNNVLQYAWLHARRQGHGAITTQDVLLGIKREFQKEGKTFQ